MKPVRSLLLFILICFSISVHAQDADLRGKVLHITDKTPLMARLTLTKSDEPDRLVITDSNGLFRFSNLNAGKYRLFVESPGYNSYEQDMVLGADESRVLLIHLQTYSEDGSLDSFVVFATPIIDVTEGSGGGSTFEGDDVVQGPRNLQGVITQDASTLAGRNGFTIGGARDYQSQVIQNGISQIGPLTPLTLNLAQVRVISNGVPAMYGDFTGGIIEITTASSLGNRKSFGFQLNSSQPFNHYNQNALETNWYNPLIRDSARGVVLGITHSMYLAYQSDPDPYYVPLYQVREGLRDSLLLSPYQRNENGTLLPSYFFYNASDFSQASTKPNASSVNAFNQLNMQYNPSGNLQFALQGSFQYTRRQIFSFSNSLLNAEHNPLLQSYTGKFNFQMNHILIRQYDLTGKKLYHGGLISKLSYKIIADYQRSDAKQTDPLYGDQIFQYGHIGEYSSRGQHLFEFVETATAMTDQHGNKVVIDNYFALRGYSDTALYFNPSSENDPRGAFTDYIMQRNQFNNYEELQVSQGLLNGQNPSNVYSMWFAPGTVLSNYARSSLQKTSIMAIVDLGVHPDRTFEKIHDLQFGILFESRSQSNYSLNANGLWTLMPQLLNRQYAKLNTDNPILSYDHNGTFTDTIYYNWLIDPTAQSNFDRALREILSEDNGYHSMNAHFVDVQSVNPNSLSMDMFSANELLNNGNAYVSYAGYDYKGNLLRGNYSLNDFLNDPQNRYIAAFNPSYSAIWLQDKFVLDAINLRAGFRIERYDANQWVLADPYCLYPVKTASEVKAFGSHPSTIGDQFAVYVDDMQNPGRIVGYRSGRTWFDAKGNELPSAERVRSGSSSGRIQPYLINPQNQELSTASFSDYQPQIQILPRLSFSFPINRTALFYAFYDQFAQRPNAAQSFTPVNYYYYMQHTANQIMPNPDLKPSKRTDYQLGFKQALGLNSILNITARYAEIKDDINLVRIDEAYPVSYTTYGNIDFSTIKSLKIEFQRVKGVINFFANYLLQYADGTGSNVNSQQALIAINQPNLRSLFPLEYDVRHKLSSNLRIQLHEMCSLFNAAPFKNTILNVFFTAQSGTPFTAYQFAVPEAQNLGNASRSQIKGNPYGSRLPWNYTLDISLIKQLKIRGTLFDFQINALNLLNTRNIFNLYSFTGLATDDGYLSSPVGLQQLNNEADAEAFAYLYSIKQLNPGHFGRPRMLSITCRASF